MKNNDSSNSHFMEWALSGKAGELLESAFIFFRLYTTKMADVIWLGKALTMCLGPAGRSEGAMHHS